MRVWPPGRQGCAHGGGEDERRGHASHDFGGWVLHEEHHLVHGRFDGDWERYRAWRDRLWAEMRETIRHPHAAGSVSDDEYLVMTVFDGDREQYRTCRDRLREELWQIMKFTDRS